MACNGDTFTIIITIIIIVIIIIIIIISLETAELIRWVTVNIFSN